MTSVRASFALDRTWGPVLIGLSAGTLMGGYQMPKGAHCLGHTLVTALVCWLVFLGWRRVLSADMNKN